MDGQDTDLLRFGGLAIGGTSLRGLLSAYEIAPWLAPGPLIKGRS